MRTRLQRTKLSNKLEVHIINLDRRRDRWLRVQKLPWKLPIRRESAIDGRSLTWETPMVKDLVAPASLKMAKTATTNRVPTVDGFSFSPHLTLGAVGTALSHRAVWKKIAARNAPAIVVEDDVDGIASQFASEVKEAIQSLQEWGLLYLGYHTESQLSRANNRFHPVPYESKKHGLITGLFGYAVSPTGAKLLLKKTNKLREQIDSQISMIDWEAVPAHQRCFVGQKTVGKPRAALIVAPESQNSDVQTYVDSFFRPHFDAPHRFLDSFV